MSVFAKCIKCSMWLGRWFPVLFLISLLSWSYYAYIILMCIFYIQESVKRCFYIIFYHFFLSIFLWSYYQVVFTEAGSPSEEFYLTDLEIYQINLQPKEQNLIVEKRAKDLPLLTRAPKKEFRFCESCKCIKPDRAHHCSVCERCVLKMDHHCPWVNNCVGLGNYKYFILFLFYAVVYCVYVMLTSLEYFIESWNEIQSFQPGRFHLIFLFFISLMFSVSVFSLFAYHIYLVMENTTTIESFRPPLFHAIGQSDKKGFDLGRKENVKQVFGNNFFKAFLPIPTSQLDGLNYPTSIIKKNEISNGSTQTAFNALLLESNNNNNNHLNSNSMNITIET